MNFNKLFTVKDVAKILNVSVAYVWEKARTQADGFPKPFKLSAKQTRWTDVQLDNYVSSRISATMH